MDFVALLGFWVSMATVCYAYVGYPLLLLAVFAVTRAWRCRSVPSRRGNDWPLVTVVIAAHNEGHVLRRKLENTLSLDYPGSRLDVIVSSDASSDRTEDIAREYAARGVQLVRGSARLGKTTAQNRVLRHLRGDIVVSTDATAVVEPQALKALVRPFLDDPAVGVVSGLLMGAGSPEHPPSGAERWYVSYDMLIRRLESATGSTVGAVGALYAVRRALFQTYPAHLSRDFGSALLAREHGLRTEVARDATCHVGDAQSLAVEYRRKRRTMSRGIQTLFHHASLLNPLRHGFFAFKLLSHKMVRWCMPGVLLILVGTSVWLSDRWSFAVVAGLLLGIAGLSATAAVAAERRPAWRIPSRLGYVAVLAVAAVAAWIQTLSGDRTPVWDPTPRRFVPEADSVDG